MKSFLEMAQRRYSVRKFQPKAVEQEKIDMIIEAAKTAPTACNNQPQKIYVLKSKESREKLAKICPCTFDAPLIFLVGYDKKLAAKGKRKENDNFGETDCTIVCSHMLFEAQDLGLGSCWVGWFAGPQLSETMGIPDDIQICHILPVGYPAEDAQPAKMHSQRRAIETVVEEI